MRLLIAALTLSILPGAVLGQTPRERVLTVSAGGAVSSATDLYLGDVRTSWRPYDGRPSVFETRYTERMAAQGEGWLAVGLESGPYVWALRLRAGSAATRATAHGNIEPARSVPGRSSWVGADALFGLLAGGEPVAFHLYAGPGLVRRALEPEGRTSADFVHFVSGPPFVSAPSGLPWIQRTWIHPAATLGAELRVRLFARTSLVLGVEQRIERTSGDELAAAHEADLARLGRSDLRFGYEQHLIAPRSVAVGVRREAGRVRRQDPGTLALSVRPREAPGANAPADWRRGLPAEVRSALEASDTAGAIALLETERERRPADALLVGTLGALIAATAPEEERSFEARVRAQRLLEEALRLDPGNPRYLLALGELHQKRAMTTDARRLMERALEAASRRPDEMTAADLADVFYRRGRTLNERVLELEGLRHRARQLPAELMTAPIPRGGRLYELLASPVPVNEPGCRVPFCRNWEYPRDFFAEFQEWSDDSPLAEPPRAELIAELRRALDLWPGHEDATRLLLATRARHGEWPAFLSRAERFAAAAPESAWARLLVALGLHRTGRGAEAEAAYGEALALLPAAERRVFEDLRVILPSADEDAWGALGPEAQAAFRAAYWRMRDPLYISGWNEREVEHYGRVALAELLFGEPQRGRRGWETDRGQLLIRYGPPANVWQVPAYDSQLLSGMTPAELHAGVAACMRLSLSHEEEARDCFEALERELSRSGDLGGRWIFWNYHPDLPSFIFSKRLGRSAVRHVPQTDSYAYAEELKAERPEAFAPPYRNAGGVPHQVARFRSADGEGHEAVIYGRLPLEALAAQPDDSVARGLHVLAGAQLIPVVRTAERSPAGTGRLDYRVILEPGTYAYSLEALSGDESAFAASRGKLEIAPAVPGALALSDLLRVAHVANRTADPRTHRDLLYQPLRCAGLAAERRVGLVFEIYGLAEDAGVARYRVSIDAGAAGGEGRIPRLLRSIRGALGLQEEREGGITFEREVTIEDGRTVEWFDLELPDSEAETMEIGVRIRDLATGREVEARQRVGAGVCAP